MANIAETDETRLDKLRRWLEQRGVDVVQVGHELTMPSPFKERAKGEVDTKRRLSVTVVKEGEYPSVRWQCWWSRGKTGKAYGGRSCYALSVLTKTTQKDIAAVLDLHYDEEVEKAETTLDKALAILTRPLREQQSRDAFRAEQVVQKAAAEPHLLPASIISLFEGRDIVAGPESMVKQRGIIPAIGHTYGLGWDYERQAVWLPWVDRSMVCRTWQWWDGTKYRFPAEEPGKMVKGDAVFGLHTYRDGKPLIVCEGCFTAMSVCGVALGGSSVTDTQVALLKACNPPMIVVAFDNDSGGFHGAIAVAERLKREIGCQVVVVFCPAGNDWNDCLVQHGFLETMNAFARCIKRASQQSIRAAAALQYRGAA